MITFMKNKLFINDSIIKLLIRIKNEKLFKKVEKPKGELTYNLNNWMRHNYLLENNKSDMMRIVRTKFIKITERILKTGRYFYYKLTSSCPNKKLFLKF